MKHKGDNQWLFSQLKGAVGMQALQGFQLYAQQVMPWRCPLRVLEQEGHPSCLAVTLYSHIRLSSFILRALCSSAGVHHEQRDCVSERAPQLMHCLWSAEGPCDAAPWPGARPPACSAVHHSPARAPGFACPAARRAVHSVPTLHAALALGPWA